VIKTFAGRVMTLADEMSIAPGEPQGRGSR